MSQEATLFLVFFADFWPPSDSAEVEIGPTPVGPMALRVSPLGSIGVVLRPPGDGERLLFDSQPVAFTGRAAMVLSVTVAEGAATLRVNGTPVLSREDSMDTLTLESADVTELPDLPSIANPDASAACAEAMQRRSHWLADPARIPNGWQVNARQITDFEQREQLGEAVESLRALAAAVGSGQRHFVGSLASLLRALLYSLPGRPSYNPLLLRLAGREHRPLPVYAFDADSPNQPPVIQEASMHITPNAPTILTLFPGQRLMDLQDWMDQPIRIERSDNGSASDASPVTLTAGAAIAEAANKFGAHYDEWVPNDLDHLRSIGVDRSTFVRFLLAVADVTCALGQWLLSEDPGAP